ncbi:probable myosin-binding protein 4 [Sesamum indicum]|uniref:Probable Myosin-binding protein 4 n=1 Tax=Sesamum indicum TaxID=4182 RepID=A0A6I9TPH1_SESIN|nr:probable myosin-binding protein 4 [Sesamum indicum]XP_011083012.1 probable myosin-binding protein 4 [Sesamum indicum]
MAAEIACARKRKHRGFMTVLSAAACEWLLMFLLFVDAVFSYLLTRFAHYCELQTPCPLCSRLDHVFGERKPGCYWSLICSNHKDEISSLVSCTVHQKLADVHGMCEECLMPIAMQNDSESCKLQVGKLWVNVERSVLQNLLLNKHIHLGSSGCKTCSCCNKAWKAKSSAERLLELHQVVLGASKANLKPPLPRAPVRSRLSRRDTMKRLRDKCVGPTTQRSTGRNGVGTLSNAGYAKLKISSDSESEVPLSEDDDDDGSMSCSSTNYSKHAYDVGFGIRDLTETPENNEASEKQTHRSSEMKDQPDLLDLNEHNNVKFSLSDALIDRGLRELSWEVSHHKPTPHLITKLIPLDDIPKRTDVVSLGASAETSNFSLPSSSALSALPDLSVHTVPSSSNTATIAKNTTNIGEPYEGVHRSATIHTEAAAGTTSDDSCLSESKSEGLPDALNQNAETMQLSGEHEVEPVEEVHKPGAVHIEAAPGTTSDDTRLSKLNSKDLNDPLGQSNEIMQLSGVHEVEPINASGTARAEDVHKSAAIHIEAAAGTTSDDNCLSESYSKNLTDPLRQSTEIMQPSGEHEVQPNNVSDTARTEEVHNSEAIHIEAAAGTTSDDTCLSESNSKNQTDSLSQNTEIMQLSGERKVEPINTSYTTRTEEDMKSMSLISMSELGLLPKQTSSKPHDEQNESTKDEETSSQALPFSASLKRNDSSYESLDGISVSDTEGESIVDRLRRQVEHYRNCLKSLYKELEEERNAAAIAANEAMAMITRLQEEKAALHMEALQYLRMMDEQAEYDMEALERANDLLAEREKELQDLEIELEFYRYNISDESGIEDIQTRTPFLENHVTAHSQNSHATSSGSKSAKVSIANGKSSPMSSLLPNFEDEKLYISKCLNQLEKNLHQAYCSGNSEDLPNGLNSDKIKAEAGNLEELPPNSGKVLNVELEENALFVQNNSAASDGKTAQDTTPNGTSSHDKENNGHYEKTANLSEKRGHINSAAFEKEIAVLHDRLEALETDQEFLKHASNLLRNGKDGMQLIQDIAHQLQELRKIEFRER